MNSSQIAALTEVSKQMILPACQLFQAGLLQCWEQALACALAERKSTDLDYELKRKQTELLQTCGSVVEKIFEQTLQLENVEEKHARSASVFSSVGFNHIELAMSVAQLEAVLKIRFNENLSLLEKRNKALFYFSSIDKQSMPFGLANITQMLRELFESIKLNQDNQLILMQHFADKFTDSVSDLYGNINRVYADAGIFPHLEQRALHFRQKATKKTDATPEISEAKKQSFELTDDSVIELFQATEAKYSNSKEIALIDEVTVAQVVQAIEAVEIPQSNMQNFKGVKQLRSLILNYLESQMGIATPVLPKLVLQSMNVLGMVAESIVTDKDLDDRVVKSLNMIVKPLLITVIKEPHFFNDGSHPARQYIEQLLQAANDWFGCRNLDELLVFGGMIQDGFTGDSNVFSVINHDLKDWLDIEYEQAQKGIQKFEAEAAGKHRLRVIRQVVEQYISRYQAATSVPFVRAYFKKVMADAMAMTILQHGKDSQSWEQLKLLASDILKLAKTNGYDIDFASKNGVDVTHRACQLMLDLNFQAADILNTESNFGSFMSWMNAEQNPKQFQTKKLTASQLNHSEVGDAISPQADHALTAAEEKMHRKFLALPAGVMLDFLYEDDGQRRKVVCWHNNEIDSVVLADPTGDQSETRSIKQVVSEMAEGVVVIIEPAQKGYVNRMINQAIKKINKSNQRRQK